MGKSKKSSSELRSGEKPADETTTRLAIVRYVEMQTQQSIAGACEMVLSLIAALEEDDG